MKLTKTSRETFLNNVQALLPNKDKPDELSSAIPPGWYMFSMCGRDIITGK